MGGNQFIPKCFIAVAGLFVLCCTHFIPVVKGEDPPALSEKKRESIPLPLEEYKGRKIAQTMHFSGAPWLVRESRQREEDCETLLKVLAPKPGQKFADIGCGNGFYSIAIAKQLGKEGRVYAVDIQSEMLRLLQARAEEAEVKNIKPVHGTLVDPKLPVGEIDMVLLVDVYHEFSHPEQMLKAIRASLKPTGRVALAEFRLEDPNVPIKLEHKMSKEQIMAEFPANGFKLVGTFDELPWQHLMFFARDDSPLEEIPLDVPKSKENE
jgi:ubiquinone/menaquinone biosynthesis C-methylase UbiE